MKQETKWMTEQLLVTLAMLPSSFTSFRVIEDSCGRIARVNVACRVTIWPHLLFLGNGTSRADEPCKHSIIIVVRENTDLSSISRLVGSAPLVLRVALKIMTARASMLRLLPPLPPPFLSPTSFGRSLPPYASKIFLRYVTDRPSVVSRVSWDKGGAGGRKGTFLLLNCLYATSFQAICSRRILLKAEVESSVSSGYFAAMVHADMANGKRICHGKLLYFIRWIFYIILYSLV